MNPTVSIVIPNYNYARFLEQRIESILNQTYQDFEIILLDDFSQDNSIEILEKYSHNSKVSHFVVNLKNSGSPFIQWQKGLNLANGKYVWIAEADDYSDTQYLEKLVPVIESDDNIALVYCRTKLIDNDDKIANTIGVWDESEKWKENFICNGFDEINNYPIIGTNIPNASAVLFSKKFAIAIPQYYTSFFRAGDWAFWIMLMQKGKVAYVSEELNYFRLHGDIVTYKSKISGLVIYEEFIILNEIEKISILKNNLLQLQRSKLTHTWFDRIKTIPFFLNCEIFRKAFSFNKLIVIQFLYFVFKQIFFIKPVQFLKSEILRILVKNGYHSSKLI